LLYLGGSFLKSQVEEVREPQAFAEDDLAGIKCRHRYYRR
jgi:hypothetical protein